MSGGVISMRKFGTMGRFANQLFQYSFLHIYAEKHHLEVQIPAWVGNHLFDLNDNPISTRLPEATERTEGDWPVPPYGTEFVNHDWRGYGQFHTSWYRPYVTQMRTWFYPARLVLSRLEPMLTRLKSLGTISVGIHLRRGDYGRSIFYVTPEQWYLDWLKTHWGLLDDPVLFIATEDAGLVEAFAKYHPVTVESLGISLSKSPMKDFHYLGPDQRSENCRALDFYPDFWILSQCDILLIPNSTFSFFPAMLNPRLCELWRSSLDCAGFVRIDPWDSHPLTYDKAEQYRHVPGVCLDETNYWRRLPNNTFKEK